LSGHDPFMGLNAGFVALILNFVVTVFVSLLSDSPAIRANESIPS